MLGLINKKALLVALCSSVLALTACGTKDRNSRVVVSPLGGGPGGPGGMGAMGGMGGGAMGGDFYDGGPLGGGNSAEVMGAASGMGKVVYFGFDSSEITSRASETLNGHANLLSNNQGANVLVVGHTDPSGGREYNMALGERRAMSVMDYLGAQGVNAGSVQISSRGEEEATGNDSEDRRAVLSY